MTYSSYVFFEVLIEKIIAIFYLVSELNPRVKKCKRIISDESGDTGISRNIFRKLKASISPMMTLNSM